MAGKSTVKLKRTEQNDPTLYTDLGALHYRGAWNGVNSYAINDVVVYNNSLYRFTVAVPAPGGLTYLGQSVKVATGATVAIGQVTLPGGCAVGDIVYTHIGINQQTTAATTAVLVAPTGASGAATQLFAQVQTVASVILVNALYGYVLTATDLTNGFITIPAQKPTYASAQVRAEVMVLRGASLTVTGSATATAAGSANMALTLPSVTPSASSTLALYLVDQENYTSTSGVQVQTMTPAVNQLASNNAGGNGTNAQSALAYLNIAGMSATPQETYTGGPMSTSSGGLPGVAGAVVTLAVDPNAAGVWDATKVVEVGAIHDTTNGNLQTNWPYNDNDAASKQYTDQGDSQAYANAAGYTDNKLADTGVQTTGVVTAVSPHTLNSQSVRKYGKVVQLHISVTLGAAISVPTSGDIGNTEVAALTAGYLPAQNAGLCNGNAGILCHGLINTAGSIQVTNVPPGATLASGTNLTFAGTFLIP